MILKYNISLNTNLLESFSKRIHSPVVLCLSSRESGSLSTSWTPVTGRPYPESTMNGVLVWLLFAARVVIRPGNPKLSELLVYSCPFMGLCISILWSHLLVHPSDLYGCTNACELMVYLVLKKYTFFFLGKFSFLQKSLWFHMRAEIHISGIL